MNRLDFLKTLGGGALAAAAVPLLPILPVLPKKTTVSLVSQKFFWVKNRQCPDTWTRTAKTLYGTIPPRTIVNYPNKIVHLTEKEMTR